MNPGLRLNLLSIFKNDFQIRSICTARQLLTVYDPSKFCEPIVKMEELNKPLAPDDPRKLKYMTSMKSDQPPIFYRDHVIDKIVRVMMKEGKKELIRTEVYAALELIKRIQYKKWMQEKDEEKRKKIILDPIEIANRAIFNCRPVMQLKKIVKVGIIYQVPHPINEEHSIFRAIKMMRDILREKCKHGKNKFRVILANELINAMNNEGFTIQAKQELHRLCEANRAYSGFKKF